ncbi:ABC transporter ATP-binding protein [Anaerocolumna sp. AGMB13025]|uniref:energy-coupling factor ABC transporter ATP-binding protein n=1 Tax=Anaerocolumna sp. AGMB13025 TaxID=3039116 RepID=UPI00241C6B7F|nr:ABC transporter ATP-binding protein [Anaerocolumna sp. AGMB13025]WFR55535.1 ABC transporter ATP-binding protein [Anaerocolumna sp. AGMB13025]
MSIIDIKDLHFSYGSGEEILKGMNLTLDERSTAIIGQNGAGKTTFVKLLKGILKPTAGEILLNGKSTKDLTVATLAKQIGMVFQNPNDQIFKNVVLDEVMFGPLQIGMDKGTAKDKALKALEMVGLLDQKGANPYDLGLSRRKLVAIASILAMDTEVIIFDEPTIAQDYAGKERIKEIIHMLRAEGKTVITIIHDMNFVAEVFERAIVFAKGKAVLDDTVKGVFLEKEVLDGAYLEQPDVMKLGLKLELGEYLNVEEFVRLYQNTVR